MGADRPLRILHFVCGVYERGGLQKHVLDLTAAQVAMGDIVAIIAHESFAPHLAAGVEVIGVDTTRVRIGGGLRREVRKAVDRWGPDVLHAHSGKGAAVAAPLLPLECAAVATVHGLKRSVRAPAKFDRVIAVSRAAARRLPRERTRVVYNGLDVAGARPATDVPALEAFFEGGAGPIVIAVGRLAPVKGFDTLVRAWRDVPDARLLLVGDGPERRRLERLVDRFGLRGRVVFAGQRADAPALIAQAALLAAPSLREGFSYVMTEAFFDRVPVVTTTTTGAAEVVPPQFLVPPRRPVALAALVRRTLEDLPGARAAFEPVFALAREELTIAGMTQRTRAVYWEAMGRVRGDHV